MSLHISVTSVNMQILNVKSLYQLATKKKKTNVKNGLLTLINLVLFPSRQPC